MSVSQANPTKQKPVYAILIAISFAHLLNDLLQAVIPAIYPRLEQKFDLSMTQIGIITLCYQVAASIFQPVVGAYTDKHPKPFSQVIGMLFTMTGIVLLAYAPSYYWILISVVLVGIGSSIFHPESSRVAFLASGGRRSFAQSVFQIGGNAGTALAPLLVAWIVIPKGQIYLLWFVIFAILAQITLGFIGNWYDKSLRIARRRPKKDILIPELSRLRVTGSIIVLLVLIFSKYFYVASITSYFQFYTMDRFGLTEVQAQVYLFYFLIAVAVGTLLGGIFGDKFGRRLVIWISVLGAAPFTLLLPYANLEWTAILVVIIGLIISSAFPAILVYAQELLPKKIGMVSGLFYGFAFGMGGLGSAVLGWLADSTSVTYIYHICSYLPLIGSIAYFLPDMHKVSFRKE
ncbi:MFS transporter [Wandonia haliotis]|uniref:MFS transporter n=1 Tax=Wandonia haliotis TaxID=574963 RepID=A0ABP3Y0Z5_9FLAO